MSKASRVRADQPAASGAASPEVSAEARTLAEVLLRQADLEGQGQDCSAELLSALALKQAAAPHDGLATAGAGLGAALAEARLLVRLAQLTEGSEDAMATLLRALVARNDLGLVEEAGHLLDAALAGLTADQVAHRAALGEIALRQDRLRHRPEATARRILADLRASPQPGGLFRAIHDAWEGWFDRGQDGALTFDLAVALHLARANAERAKGVQHTQALADMALTQFRLGEREGRAERLRASVASFRAVLAGLPRKSGPEDWAGAQVNLGIALATLAGMEEGTARLEEAVTCHRQALQVQTRARHPEDWAATSQHLAQALLALAARKPAAEPAREALAILSEIGAAPEEITAAEALAARLS